jgi:hypothetical protein
MYTTCMPRNVRAESSLPWPERHKIAAPTWDFFHLDLVYLFIFILYLNIIYNIIYLRYIVFFQHKFLVFREAGSIACAVLIRTPAGRFTGSMSLLPSRADLGPFTVQFCKGHRKTWNSGTEIDQT